MRILSPAAGRNRSGAPCLLLLGLLASLSHAQSPAARPNATPKPQALDPAALEVARMGFFEGGVEIQRPGGPWVKAAPEAPLAIGDRVRTLPGASARLDFPWTAIALADRSEVSLERSRVLTLQLQSGRIDIDPEQDLLHVVTSEASVSGSGRTLIRREGTTTFVGSYNGGAEVEAEGSLVRLGVSQGTVVNAGAAPRPAMALPPSPRVVSPAGNPRYVKLGQVVQLIWTGREETYHLDVLSIDSDVPVVSLDVLGREFSLQLGWLGTFRWRVSSRDGAVESEPSGEGLICVVEK